jgi:hypothetical protein
MLPKAASRASLHLPGPFLVRCILWCLCLVLVPLPADTVRLSFQVEVLCATTFGAHPAPSGLLAHPASAEPLIGQQELTDRILSRLEMSEKREVDPWLRDDVRQSWISLSTFSRGKFPTFPDAFVAASYLMYGVHPDQVWPKIVADRKAKLGREYHDWYDANDNALPVNYEKFWGEGSSPKKPVRSVGRKKPPDTWAA